MEESVLHVEVADVDELEVRVAGDAAVFRFRADEQGVPRVRPGDTITVNGLTFAFGYAQAPTQIVVPLGATVEACAAHVAKAVNFHVAGVTATVERATVLLSRA